MIDELSSAYDANNKEYLTGEKLKDCDEDYEDELNSINKNENHKNIPNLLSKSPISNTFDINYGINKKENLDEFPSFLNQNLEYFRTPQVIKNNEKLMLDIFKKKSIFIKKIPYLSRSRNDLNNFDYKEMKNKSSNSKRITNIINNNNSYLKDYMQPEKKIFYEEKIGKSESMNNYNKISFSFSRLNNQKKIKIKRNILLPYIKRNSQTMILKDNNNYSVPKKEKKIRNDIVHNSSRNKEYNEKIERLSNKDLLRKLKNSVKNLNSMRKVHFSDNNSNKIVLLFRRNFIQDE